MKYIDKDNLMLLHICLTQIYQDFLMRVVEAGESESSALGAADAYLNGVYGVDFNISMRVNNLEVKCLIQDHNVFSANLSIQKNTSH